MWAKAKIADSFSPYLDDSPIYDGMEEYRIPTATALTLLIHSALFLTFSMTFLLPIQPVEPEVIPVKIYTEITEAQDEPPAETQSTIITPAAPTPKPRPRPTAKINPAPPPPLPAPQPINEVIETPDPEPLPAPAPTILIDETPLELEDLAIADPSRASDAERLAAVEKLIAQDLERQALERELEPQPIIEQAPIEPEIIPEIIPEFIPQEIVEPLPEIVPEIIPDEIITPSLDIETPPEPEPFIFEPIEEPLPQLPVFEDTPQPVIEELEIIVEAPEPEFIIPDAAPGAIIDVPVLEPVEPETVVLPDPEPSIPEPVTPETITPDPDPILQESPVEDVAKPSDDIDKAPISAIETPKVLADSAAPTNQIEQDRAVDKSQASTGRTSTPSPSGGSYKTPSFGGNSGGGGAFPRSPTNNGPVPSGVSSRPRPGAGGWSLGPKGSYAGDQPKGGLGGISIDMRCRDIHRNHEDCPEYAPKPKGRSADGTEGFGAHSIAGSGRGQPNGTSRVGSSVSPFGSGKDFTAHTNGGPSTNVLDNAGFAREFRTQPLILNQAGSDLDKFSNAPIGTEPNNNFKLDRQPTEDLPEEKDPWSLR